jgi:hypothetical protein
MNTQLAKLLAGGGMIGGVAAALSLCTGQYRIARSDAEKTEDDLITVAQAELSTPITPPQPQIVMPPPIIQPPSPIQPPVQPQWVDPSIQDQPNPLDYRSPKSSSKSAHTAKSQVDFTYAPDFPSEPIDEFQTNGYQRVH